MSYCVYTLSDSTGVRFVGTGPEDDPLLAFKKIEACGLRCGLGDWLDSLDAPPAFSVVLNGVDAREADRASRKLIGRLPGLINLPQGKPFETRRCIAIFANGHYRWFPSIVAMCKHFGVSRFNGIDVTGRILSQRRRRQTRATAAQPGPMSLAPAAQPGPASLAPSARVDAEAPATQAGPNAAAVDAAEPAAGEKPQKAGKNRHIQRFLGALCCKDTHFAGIYERIEPDRNTAASDIPQKTA